MGHNSTIFCEIMILIQVQVWFYPKIYIICSFFWFSFGRVKYLMPPCEDFSNYTSDWTPYRKYNFPSKIKCAKNLEEKYVGNTCIFYYVRSGHINMGLDKRGNLLKCNHVLIINYDLIMFFYLKYMLFLDYCIIFFFTKVPEEIKFYFTTCR